MREYIDWVHDQLLKVDTELCAALIILGLIPVAIAGGLVVFYLRLWIIVHFLGPLFQ